MKHARKSASKNPFAAAAGMVSAPVVAKGRVYHKLWDDDREAA